MQQCSTQLSLATLWDDSTAQIKVWSSIGERLQILTVFQKLDRCDKTHSSKKVLSGHSLVVETVDVVHSFYQSDDISRVSYAWYERTYPYSKEISSAYSEFKQKFPD